MAPQLLAQVAVPVPLGQAFTYSVPDTLAADVRPGARVLCEFGPRRVLGVVLAVGEGVPEFAPERLKPIAAVVDAEPVIPEELLEFLVELGRYYLAPIGEVMRLALPAVERAAADTLARQGLLDGTEMPAVGRLVHVARALPEADAASLRAGPGREVLEWLREAGPTPVKDLEQRRPGARAALRRLEKAGLVALERRQAARDPFFAPSARDTPPELTAAQRAAVDAIVSRLDAGQRGAYLLHGVTASGKTEVYLHAAARCLELGGGVIVLVPEIALTPQLVARFRARLGDSVAALHSGLSDAERHAMWKALRTGALRVAVGARSALFAPVERLRLVCVDEEHDPSFKQEEGVRYSARDMALLRAHRAGAVAVVGSATPSLATEALVRSGKLTRLRLPERARSVALPEVEIVDLRRVGPGPSGERLLSLPLHRALERVLDARQQAILFLNRRGFSPSVLCDDCGQIVECPNCSVALTLHRARGSRLICHYCDYAVPPPSRCEACGGAHMAEEGAGTERIEAAVAAALPGARVARLDRDVGGGLKSEKILARMRRGEIDVLVGTQMVTKGHDIPAVTLVGVLNADAALSMPDYQASERTFHLLVQVAGRAGRGDAPGTVIIQTRNPTHFAIRHAAAHDVDGFMEAELREREELAYPPFSRLALLRLDSLNEGVAGAEAQRLAALARRAAPAGVQVLGPAPAPIARLRNRYRFRVLLRAPERRPLRQALVAVARATVDRRVRVAIDVDPGSML